MNSSEIVFIENVIDYLDKGGTINNNMVASINELDYRDKALSTRERLLLWDLFRAVCISDSKDSRYTAATIAANLMFPKIKSLFVEKVMERDKKLDFSDLPSFFSECWICIYDRLPKFDVKNYGSKFAHFIKADLDNTAINFDRELACRSYYIEKTHNVGAQSYEQMIEKGEKTFDDDTEEYEKSPEEIVLNNENSKILESIFLACNIKVANNHFEEEITKENLQMFTACNLFLGDVHQSFKKKAIFEFACHNQKIKEKDEVEREC